MCHGGQHGTILAWHCLMMVCVYDMGHRYLRNGRINILVKNTRQKGGPCSARMSSVSLRHAKIERPMHKDVLSYRLRTETLGRRCRQSSSQVSFRCTFQLTRHTLKLCVNSQVILPLFSLL